MIKNTIIRSGRYKSKLNNNEKVKKKMSKLHSQEEMGRNGKMGRRPMT